MTTVHIPGKDSRRATTTAEDLAQEQPTSITELQPIIEDFVKRLKVIEHEITTLNEDKKALVDEFSDKLDTKTLKAAMRIVAIREKVTQKDTFDTFVEVLERL